jgi:hypothetical protein
MTDSIVDGVTGALVEPADPSSLAEGILRLLRDPQAARQFGRAGRERMLANFTLERTADSLAALYRQKASEQRQGFRPHIAVLHLVGGSLVCLAIVLRYCVLDTWLLQRWDAGWRPWRANALTLLPMRMWLYRVYAFIGSRKFGYRQRARMWLYRCYAFVGSRKFGYRRRFREFLRGLIGHDHGR